MQQVSQLMYPSFHDSTMPHLKDGLLFTSVVFHHTVVLFLLMQGCAGQSAVIGPLQPIIASVGDDITLPCHLEPAVDAATITFEWTRPDLTPRFVHVWRSGENLMDLQNPAYKGRTSISEEKLKSGDISLKLSEVKLSDEGKYRCFLPLLEKETFVELIVGAVSTSSTVGIEKVGHGLVLQCNSTGWYPEPEVFWLDGEGNLLSAGPTETVRGPDDLYTVSSRVTVEKRHSNSFTCRVQQNSTNQIREALIHVPDDFFEVQSSSSSTTVILAITLAVCILVILILGFYVWRLKKTREKKQNDEMFKKEEEKHMKSKCPIVTRQKLKEEKQKLKEEKQKLKEEKQKLKEEQQKLKEEQQRREEAENRVQILEEELQKLKEEQQKKTREKQNSSSLSQNSTRKPAVDFKVDPGSEYIQLTNTSTEVQQLGGWTLKIQVNFKETIKHTFEDSFNLKAKQDFTVGCCGYYSIFPHAQLVLEDLKLWCHADILQVSLISHPGEIQYNLDRIY